MESEKRDAFTEDDRDFLEHVAGVMARRLCTARKTESAKRSMSPRIRRVWQNWLAAGARGIGQIEIRQTPTGFVLCSPRRRLPGGFGNLPFPDDAEELAKFDDQGNYRPLKTAPNLRHNWRLELADLDAVQRALDLFYPGRLAALTAWEAHRLSHHPLA